MALLLSMYYQTTNKMKLLKPVLMILFILAFTYSVKAGITHSHLSVFHTPAVSAVQPTLANPSANVTETLSVHGDLFFAFIAIVSLSGYLVFKK